MRRTRPYDREFAIPLVKNTLIRVGFDINKMGECISSAINYLKENHIEIIERYLRKHKND